MKLIVGLGNPEDMENFANTRHNMGFNTLNKLAKKYNINISKTKFDGLYGTGTIEGEKVVLVKPQTYMNNSGECVVQFVNFYKIDLNDLIVIYDDIDIKPGFIRIRKSGAPGSHNGMKSVTAYLCSRNFPRIRIGIGKPEHKHDLINYVIGNMPEEEKELLDKSVDLAEQAVEAILKYDIDKAMNTFNSQVIEEEHKEEE